MKFFIRELTHIYLCLMCDDFDPLIRYSISVCNSLINEASTAHLTQQIIHSRIEKKKLKNCLKPKKSRNFHIGSESKSSNFVQMCLQIYTSHFELRSWSV